MCASAGLETSAAYRHHIKVCMRDMNTRQARQLNVGDIEPDRFQVAGAYIMWFCERTLIFLSFELVVLQDAILHEWRVSLQIYTGKEKVAISAHLAIWRKN